VENLVWLIFLVLGILVLNQLAHICRAALSMELMTRRLLAHQGIEWGTKLEPSPTVIELLNSAGKIAAIKAYREQTGLGLEDAREVVEKISRGTA
jgi:ribosomal protein L7/L12